VSPEFLSVSSTDTDNSLRPYRHHWHDGSVRLFKTYFKKTSMKFKRQPVHWLLDKLTEEVEADGGNKVFSVFQPRISNSVGR
jgi:hypothetical protein